MNESARYQVVEVKYGHAVKDTKTGGIISCTYTRLGNAVNKAIRENEAVASLKYSK